MVATVVALVESYVFAGFAGEALEHIGTDALIAWTVERELGVLGVCARRAPVAPWSSGYSSGMPLPCGLSQCATPRTSVLGVEVNACYQWGRWRYAQASPWDCGIWTGLHRIVNLALDLKLLLGFRSSLFGCDNA